MTNRAGSFPLFVGQKKSLEYQGRFGQNRRECHSVQSKKKVTGTSSNEWAVDVCIFSSNLYHCIHCILQLALTSTFPSFFHVLLSRDWTHPLEQISQMGSLPEFELEAKPPFQNWCVWVQPSYMQRNQSLLVGWLDIHLQGKTTKKPQKNITPQEK